MLVQLRRALGPIVAVLVAGLFVVWAPGAASPAQALACVGSSICNPANMWVLEDLAGSGAAGGSAAAVPSAAVSTGAAVGTGVGAWGWLHGWWDTTAPAAKALTGGAAVAPGWVGSQTVTIRDNSYNNPVDVTVRIDVTQDLAYGAMSGVFRAAGTVVGIGGGCTTGTAVRVVTWSMGGVGINETTPGVWSDYGGGGGSNGWNCSGGLPGSGNGNIGGNFNLDGGWDLKGGLAQVNVWLGQPGGAGPVIVYKPSGSPSRPSGTASGTGNLVRYLHCQNATSSVDITDSIPASLVSGGKVEVPPLTCPDGMVAGGYGADWKPSGGGSTQTVVPTTPMPPTVTGMPSNQPECVSQTAGCTLQLLRIQPSPTTNCGAAAIACPDWYTDPARSSNYECHFGPYTVALDLCSVFRVPGQVLPNTKTDPGTGTTSYVPWPPLPDGSTPGTGGATSPADCFPTGWGLANPVEWVLMPVKCALNWAFVPADGFWTTQWQQLQASFGTRAPFSVIAVIPSAVDGLSSGWSSPCSSLPNFSTIPDKPLRMPCSPPDSPGWRAGYGLMIALVWITAVFALWRMAHNAVGGNE